MTRETSLESMEMTPTPMTMQPELRDQDEPTQLASKLDDAIEPLGQWSLKAVCLDAEPETFFPEKGGSTREAKRICAECPVSDECLEYAIEYNERFGIWGGKSTIERNKEKRERAKRQSA